MDTLTAAISKSTFYNWDEVEKLSDWEWSYRRRNHQPKAGANSGSEQDERKLAQDYVQFCLDLRCPDVVANLIDRAVDVTNHKPRAVMEYALDVLLPLAAYCAGLAQDSDYSGNWPLLRYDELRQEAVKHYLDYVEKNKAGVEAERIAQLVAASAPTGDPKFFMNT